MPQNKPLVSVIVPAYNAQETIQDCLDSLASQSYENFEVIVVDNNSTDETRKIAGSYDKTVKLYSEGKKGSFAARNTGVEKSQGEILAFIDSDCVAPEDWLLNLTKPITEDSEVAVYGGSSDSQETRWSRTEHAFEEGVISEFRVGRYVNMGDTKNLGVTRKVFDELGGFDESFLFSSDTDFGLRLVEAGYRIRLAEGCRVRHRFKAGLAAMMKVKFRHGFWGVRAYLGHKKYLVHYGIVLREVKYGLYSLAASLVLLLTFFFSPSTYLIMPLILSLLFSVFMFVGSTHTLVPLLKRGPSDYIIYAMVHSIAWRLGGLWYMLHNPLTILEMP